MSSNKEENIAAAFARDGFRLIRNFYDYEAEVRPIVDQIRTIIQLVADEAAVEVDCSSNEAALTSGFNKLIAHDRKLGGYVYDAVKQIPAFMRLVCDTKNEALFKQLRSGAVPGLAAGGYGIRINIPHEDQFRAFWHQEFPAQVRSLDGVVFWSPLVPVERELGPVELAVGSHREGLVPVDIDPGFSGRSGPYALRLKNEAERIAKYERLAPLTNPGDLILMDFLTLHQSGHNKSDRALFSMQFRYFNFADPVGQHLHWSGGFAEGKTYDDIFQDIKSLQGA